MENMPVRVEIWPVAADRVGMWLLSGEDAWRSGNVRSDSEPHTEVEFILGDHDAVDKAALLHSTSWRVDGPALLVTYMAVIGVTGLIRDRWPNALPVSLDLATAVGKPPTHSPLDPPAPRHIDVLIHGLRHLRFLLETDATNAAALDENWRRHLSGLAPALAGMYDQHHQPDGS
ncbi:hypothetical protein [Actinomadura sp. 7K507]|uniref:hypothetical protein n=1 Tax=Actinomadura sp. 7K507 TaxID=2530365 RepID=UPI00104E2BDE|nr:hypothetical protein [Actinomadura sp. 7K507]TDC96024.1 hypothetical protein E1285_06275 [Actinomadura sp. 7K507]